MLLFTYGGVVMAGWLWWMVVAGLRRVDE